ncbi:hemagluttinin repeat protein [Clostridium sp. CAG:715]|nr:hemagluttinin repeat protein [Clostridium sp. CAG:715]
MNKKQLIIAAIAATLSVSGAFAATDITGVNGNNGVFNITPDKLNGEVGYRKYDNFNLSAGDIANLIYKYGNSRDINTFINLVQNGVKIDGILNTMRDGNFYNGQAVFITPGGMTVGASGVLNVGSLSVITPTNDAYNSLKGEYASNNFANINNISSLLNKSSNVGNISIDGKILAREGVQLRGGQINVGANGAIVNGITSTQAFTDRATAATNAEALFNNLVNTSGIKTASAFTKNGSNIQIKSSTGVDIAGKVINGAADASGITSAQGNSGVFITNSGSNGTKISGLVQSTHELNVFNKAGDMTINGTLKNEGANLNVSNKGGNVAIGGTLSSDRDIAVTNNSSTGSLAFSGTAKGANANFVNEGAGGMNVTGAVSGTKARFINRGGKLVIANTADKVAADRVDVVNYGNGGASIGGINAENGLYVVNHKGNLSVDGHVTTGDDATISIRNAETAGKLAVGSNGHIDGQGKVALRNQGANGMTIDGKVTNDNALGNAETSIINENGALLVNGKINNNGNMAIKNTGSGMTISKNAVVTNEGQLKVKNYGAGGMTIVGDVNNTGNVTFYNDAGKMKLATTEDGTKAGNITNEDGRLIIWSRNNSTGISAASSSKIINNGNGNSLAIKHTGTTAAGSKGLDLQGTIRNDGETAINNYSGDMYISGNIQSDGSLGIINRAGAGKADFASAGSITSDKNINIKNYGSGDMTVNNTITNNGRLNIIANTGKLNLGGTVHNDSNGALDDNNGFYAVSRDQGTGINLSSGFKADGAGQNLIKNISGSEGLRYEGNINASGSQTELYNQKGNMTVGGTLATTGDGKVVVLNKGDGMKLDGIITSEKDAKIVNKGLEHAENNAKVTTPNKIWFYEKLK